MAWQRSAPPVADHKIALFAISGIIFLPISTYMLAKYDPAQFMTAPRDGFSPDSFLSYLPPLLVILSMLCLHFKGFHVQDFSFFFFNFSALVAKGRALAWWSKIQSCVSCREHYPQRLIWKSRNNRLGMCLFSIPQKLQKYVKIFLLSK